jgi:UDPglucose--hexose-1-phosphate uridylyltransferase
MSELRKDPVSGRWVIIAPERSRRPAIYQFEQYGNSSIISEGSIGFTKSPTDKKFRSTGNLCPFCPGNEHLTLASISTLFDENNHWKVRVFANKFPALRVEGDIDKKAEGLYDYISGIGAHEIIIDTPHHDKGIADLKGPDMEAIIKTYQARIQDLYNDQRLRFVMIYKNFGFNSGSSIDHSHSQLIATPIIPENLKIEYDHARKYFLFKERCLFCDLLNQELNDGRRIISENDDFILYTPYASRLPFEMHIFPRKHQHDFTQISPKGVQSLASILREALLRLKIALDNPSYNFIIHSSPNKGAKQIPGQWQTIHEDYHWHIEILPRILFLAGFEWGTGFFINPSLPEETSKYLRSIKVH